MAKCILWTPGVYEEFLTKGQNLLSERQKQIIKGRTIDELSIGQLAARLNVSEQTIHKDIRKIRDVYKLLQKTSSTMHPIFKNSKEIENYISTL